MSYAKIINGSVVTYPYTIDQLRAEYPNLVLPRNPTPEQLSAEWNVYTVVQTGQPVFDPLTQKVVQITPAYNGALSRWETQWQVVALSAEELAIVAAKQAAQAQAAQDTADTDAAKADATIQYLISHTPAQCYQKVQTDVTDLASAKVMLGRMAMALSVLGRNTLR
jgi:hypothetical protein